MTMRAKRIFDSFVRISFVEVEQRRRRLNRGKLFYKRIGYIGAELDVFGL